MKKILTIVAAAVLLSACNNKAEQQKLQASRDSIQAMKQAYTVDSLKKANELAIKQKEEAQQAAVASRHRAEANTRVAGYTESGEAQQPVKQGMKKGTKDALIGAGVGAVTGVLIDKKNGRGAIIGGVVGAGTGYAIGHSKDKKSGRVQ